MNRSAAKDHKYLFIQMNYCEVSPSTSWKGKGNSTRIARVVNIQWILVLNFVGLNEKCVPGSCKS